MQPIYDWFRLFYERTGINLTFIYDNFDRARMIKGFWLTIELSRHEDLLNELRAIARKGPVTLVYAARDEDHNEAVMLRDVLVN